MRNIGYLPFCTLQITSQTINTTLNSDACSGISAQITVWYAQTEKCQLSEMFEQTRHNAQKNCASKACLREETYCKAHSEAQRICAGAGFVIEAQESL